MNTARAEAARQRIINAALVEFASKSMTAHDMARTLNRTIRSASSYPFTEAGVVELLTNLGLIAAPPFDFIL